MTSDPREPLERLREFVREHRMGGCRILSGGAPKWSAGCQCPLCNLDNAMQQAEQQAVSRFASEQNEKIEKFRLYSANCARSGKGSGKFYDTSDLCAAQARAIRQLQEYLNPQCDSYLIALVEYHAAKELADPVDPPKETT